jgi:glycosyltransferase involved in cell wall biosynthesis
MVGSEIAPIKNNIIVGGVANSVVRLAQGLHNNYHEVSIVTSRPRIFCETPDNLEFTIHQIPIKHKYPSFSYGAELAFKSIIEIKKLDRLNNFHIIHGHSGEPQIALIPNIAGMLFSKPSIYTLYCPIRPADKSAKFCLSKLSQIITITENVKDSVRKLKIPLEKIIVIPPAIDTQKYNRDISGKELRAKLGLKNDNFVILFVGNLTYTKGIDVLLEALKPIKEKFPHVKLLMTLEMPHDNYLRRKKEILTKINCFGLEKNIIEFGIIENMAELIAASDTLVAPFLDTYGPSDYPLPVLEAMAIGKPVIATKIGGMPEIIEHMKNGILIQPNDVNSLQEAFRYLLENTQTQYSMGTNASNSIQERLSIPIVTKQMEAVYEQFARI